MRPTPPPAPALSSRRPADLERRILDLEKMLDASEREVDALRGTLQNTLSFQRLAETVGSATGIDAILDALATAVRHALPSHGLVVYMLQEDGLPPRCILEDGDVAGHAEQVALLVEDGIVDWALSERSPVVLPENDRLGDSTWVLVPLSVLGAAVGFFQVRSGLDRDEITGHHLEMLRLGGAQAAAALDNHRRLGQLQEGLTERESLYRAAARLGSSLDLADVFDAVALSALERFQCEVVVIASVGAEGDGLPRVRTVRRRDGEAPEAWEASRSVLLAACEHREPILVTRRQPGRFLPELDHYQVDVLHAVPFVHHQNTVLGALLVAGRDEARLEAESSGPWLRALSTQATAAIENARLYEDLLSVNAKMAEMQSRLVQAGRLAGIGQLAGGIAHEINNPLQIILGKVQIVSLQLAEHPHLREELKGIETETRRIAQIVRGLMDFSRQGGAGLRREPVSLRAVRDAVLELLDHQFRKAKISVLREGDEAVYVEGHADELKQALLNICLNALQILSSTGGEIVVRILAEGAKAVVEIQDNGPGIPLEIMDRVFDPFFSTRADATGLGLSLSYGILQRHGGSLDVVPSESANGACFRMTLPRLLPDRVRSLQQVG